MWTLATALSSQFDSFRDHLYSQTKHMLESLDACENDMDFVMIEQVQAWLLLAFYEFARSNYRRGWVSAGRAFRLVQLARLHEIDCPEHNVACADPVLTEEKRRTFWVAYCLDRFISIRKHWPLTLVEEVVSRLLSFVPRLSYSVVENHNTDPILRRQICTRLPSPEHGFQGGQVMQMPFLSEAIASDDHSMMSPLAECVVLSTICGRTLSHSQVSNVERAYGSTPADLWARHEWLDGMLTKRLASLATTYPLISAPADPLMIFTFMIAHTTTIHLCQIMEASGIGVDCNSTALGYQKRALRAAREIANLSKAHEHSGYFKVCCISRWKRHGGC